MEKYNHIYKRHFLSIEELVFELDTMKDYKDAGKVGLILNYENKDLNEVFDVLDDKKMSYEEISFENYISMNARQQAVFSEVYLTKGIPNDIDFLIVNGDVHDNFVIEDNNVEMLVIQCNDLNKIRNLRGRVKKDVSFFYTS